MNFVVVTLTVNRNAGAGRIPAGDAIMDTRLSCYAWGTIGVIFGLIALFFPDTGLILTTFYVIFLVLTGLGIAVFLFLAITSSGDESIFLFGISAVLLILGVFSFLAHEVFAIIFLLIIAGIAFYNGFTSITLALTQPWTKYILIPGVFIAGIVLLAVLLLSFPVLSDNLAVVIIGNFALVFGLFSIIMGYFQKEVPDESIAANNIPASHVHDEPERKK
jgi:hypothetical protein